MKEMNISLICTLNLNQRLNFPIKRQKLAEQIKKQYTPAICCLQRSQIQRHKQTSSERHELVKKNGNSKKE